MPDFDDADIVTPPNTADFEPQDVVAKPVRAPVAQTVAQSDFDVADVATAPQVIGDFEAGDVVSATQPPATPRTPRKLGVDLGVEPLPLLPVDTTKPIGAAESIALREEAKTGVRPTALSTLAKTASAGLARMVEKGVQEPALADLARGTKTTFFGPKKLEELDDDELSTTAAFAGISLPFVNDALDDWDKTTGKQFKSDAERKQARSLFVQGLAGEVLRERLQNKVDAGEQLNQRDQTLWAKLAAPAVRNTEEVMRFMAGAPAAVALGAGQRFGELTQPKRELQDGQVVETAEGDTTRKALAKSIIGAGVEYAIERKGGELLNAGVGKVFRALPGGKALLGSISKMPVIGQAIDTFGKLARITGQQGLAGEVFEEGLQALADEGVGFAVRGAEKTTPISQRLAATARTFAQPENIKDLVLGMLLTQAVQGGAAATTAWQKQATQGRNLDGILTAFGADGQTLRGMTLEDKQNAYAAIQQQLTPEKAQAVLQRMGGRAADAYNQIAEAKGFGFATTADPQERLTKKVEYVQDTAKRLAGDVPVVAYATEADLIAANPEIAQAADYQPNTITGVYHNGQTHIVLDKMRTPQDIVSTVLHESGVHASLARMTPADKERILSGIGKDAMKRASAISQTLGIGDVPSAEEALALIGEQRVVNPSAYQRGVNALRNQIRAVYPSLKLNNSDLAVIIGDAQKAVRGEGGTFAVMATVAPEAEQATTAAPVAVSETPVGETQAPLMPTSETQAAPAPVAPAPSEAVTPTPEVVTPAVEPQAQVQELAPQPPPVVEQAPVANVTAPAPTPAPTPTIAPKVTERAQRTPPDNAALKREFIAERGLTSERVAAMSPAERTAMDDEFKAWWRERTAREAGAQPQFRQPPEQPRRKKRAAKKEKDATAPDYEANRTNESPLQREWGELKKRNPTGVLAVRLGDFYEFFNEDAETAKTALDLKLAQRNGVKMAGIPVHAFDAYAAKLLQAGHDVHVVEYDATARQRYVKETIPAQTVSSEVARAETETATPTEAGNNVKPRPEERMGRTPSYLKKLDERRAAYAEQARGATEEKLRELLVGIGDVSGDPEDGINFMKKQAIEAELARRAASAEPPTDRKGRTFKELQTLRRTAKQARESGGITEPKPAEAKAPEASVSARIEVETAPDGDKTVSVPSKDTPAITPKEQKRYLLAEIDKAIETAPSDRYESEREDDYNALAKRLGLPRSDFWQKRDALKKGAESHVLIQVPGDGEFRIVNTLENLWRFKEAVEKRFPEKKMPKSMPHYSRARPELSGEADWAIQHYGDAAKAADKVEAGAAQEGVEPDEAKRYLELARELRERAELTSDPKMQTTDMLEKARAAKLKAEYEALNAKIQENLAETRRKAIEAMKRDAAYPELRKLLEGNYARSGRYNADGSVSLPEDGDLLNATASGMGAPAIRKLQDEIAKRIGVPERIKNTERNRRRFLMRKGEMPGTFPLSRYYGDVATDFTPEAEPEEAQPEAEGGSDIRFRRAVVTPEQDAEYLAAVERGDMEAAQRMVDEAAKRAGYGTQFSQKANDAWEARKYEIERAINIATSSLERSKQAVEQTDPSTTMGRIARNSVVRHMQQLVKLRKELISGAPPNKLFHGRNAEWTVYRRKDGGRSIWASDSSDVSGSYGTSVIPLYFKTENPMVFDADGDSFRNLEFEGNRVDADDLSKIAEERGYDGLIIKNFYDSNTDDGGDVIADHYTVFSPFALKSADPVTRDDAGNVIPLSQRFNDATPDIRFRRAVTPAEDYQRDLRDAGLADRYVQVPKGETEDVRKAQLFRNLLYADGLDREGRDGLRRQAEAELSQGKTAMALDAAAGAYNTDRSIDTARMVTVMNATMLDAVKPDASVETMDLADEVNLKAQEKFTRLGRALAFLRDRFNTPEGRRAELARILMMPDDVAAEKLKVAKTEAERRAIRRPVIQKARQRLKDLSKVQVIGADGKRTPLDINAFTSDQLMDDVLFKDAVSKIVQQRSSFGDKLYEFWQNSILSGPVTLFMVNPIGNAANIALELGPQRQAEILLGKAFRSKDAPTEASTAAGFRYANAAMPDAWKNARMTFTTEQPQLGEYANKWDAGNQAIGRKLFGLDVGVDVGKIVRAPRNILSATDQGFRTWLMNFHIADLATRDFDNALKDPQSGITESDREAFIQAALKDDSEFYAKAEQIADRELFQSKPGVLGQMFLSARRSENPVARELSRYLLPFVTTPANVIKTGARKTPLGTIPLVWNFARGKYTGTEAGKAEGVRLAAEQAVGWGVMMAVAALMEGDDDDPLGRPRITGTQQTSGRFRPGEREYEKRNEPPMSVRIGDNWYSYRRLEPIATILATVVDILNAGQQAKAGNLAKAGEIMANSLVGMFSDRTYLKTVGDIIDAVRDNDPGSYMKIATGTVAGFVPNIAKSTMRGFDPIIRDIRNRSPKGTMEWLETSGKRLAQMAFPSPAVIEQPIARYDVYGRPLEKAGGPVENIVSPFTRQRADKMTRIDAMLKRYADRTGEMNVLPAPPQVPDIKLFGEKKPVTLTDEEFAEYQQLAGQAAAKRLATMTFRDYDNPTQYDVKRVQDVFKTARANAKVKMAGKVRQRVKRERGMTP